MATPAKQSLIAVVSLLAIAVAIVAALGFLSASTADRIQVNQQAYEMRQVRELLSTSDFDNNLFDNLIWIRATDPDAQLLGAGESHYIARATRNGEPSAAIFNVTTLKGYSGPIELMIGVYADGTLAGVRVVRHRETRGLGDQIELQHSDWIRQFEKRSLNNPEVSGWRIRRDGGEFDQLTGASVTPRAIVSAVRDALLYFTRHKDAIFAAPAQKKGATP